METLGLDDLLGRIGGTVAVAGSLNADYSVRCERLPGPGETVAGSGLSLMAGGKSANQAVSAARLGARVQLVGAVGSDDAADFLLSELAAAGVDTGLVSRMHGPTGTAVISVDAAGENSIVVSPGANALVSRGFVWTRRSAILSASVLGLCLEVPMEAVVEAARIAHGAGVRVLLNDSPLVRELPRELVAATDVLLVNEHELAQLAGVEEPGGGWLAADWEAVRDRVRSLGFPEAIVTLGAEGSVVLAEGGVSRVEPVRVEATDTTGCGDAYMGCVLAGLASGLALVECARLASFVSAYAACAAGAQPSYGTPSELRTFLASM